MKHKVILDLDYNQGAIWLSIQETGEPLTGIDIIDTNKDIAIINKKISDLYSSYYDSNCTFNNERFINDGSYEIEDRITKLYK